MTTFCHHGAMLQRWWFPSTFALILALVMLGPVLGPGALLNLDLVGVEHWPTPRSMWGIGPELPRSVPAELLFSAIAWATSGATAMKLWFVACIAGSFLTMFRLLRGMEIPTIAWYAGGVAYAVNPYLLTRLAVGHTTLAGVYAIAPLVLPIILRGTHRRPQVVLASAALAFMGFFGGLVWGVATLFGLMQGGGSARVSGIVSKQRESASLHAASFAMHLPWLVPSLFLLSDGPSLVVDDLFRQDGGIGDTLSLVTGYGFWQPGLEPGIGKGWLSAAIGAFTLALAAVGAPRLHHRFGRPSAVSVVLCSVAIAALNRSGSTVDWLFDIPGSSALREPHRFLVLVIWWIIPASILGAQRLLDQLSEWTTATSSQAGLLIPAALSISLIAPAVWGVHPNVKPVDVPAEWNTARATIQSDPGTILVLPWNRYIDVSFADNRRVLNPALRYFGPDIIHDGDLGLADADESVESDLSRETVDARVPSLRNFVSKIPTAETNAKDLADHGIRWVLVLHEVDYRGFLSLADVEGINHTLANEHLDLFRVESGPSMSPTTKSLPDRFAGYVAASDSDRLLATPSPGGWINTKEMTESGLVLLPAGSSGWHYRSFLVLLSWLFFTLVLVSALRKFRRPA